MKIWIFLLGLLFLVACGDQDVDVERDIGQPYVSDASMDLPDVGMDMFVLSDMKMEDVSESDMLDMNQDDMSDMDREDMSSDCSCLEIASECQDFCEAMSLSCGSSLDPIMREVWMDPMLRQNSQVNVDDSNEVAQAIFSRNYPPLPDLDPSDWPDSYDVGNLLKDSYGLNWGWNDLNFPPTKHEPFELILHHTVGRGPTCDSYLKSFSNDHIYTRGWGDIGYHFVICQESDGAIKVYEGRFSSDVPMRNPWNAGSVVAAHVKGANTGRIGVSVVGDYRTDMVSEELELVIKQVFARLRKEYQIDPDSIFGHRERGSTVCPADLMDLIPSLIEHNRMCADNGF